jgi:hypothetical protein
MIEPTIIIKHVEVGPTFVPGDIRLIHRDDSGTRFRGTDQAVRKPDQS